MSEALAGDAADSDLSLIAYQVNDAPMRLVPAPSDREWMTRTDQQFAKRCLPMLIANQAGWHVLNDQEVAIEWDGGRTTDALKVTYGDSEPLMPAVSLFGHGIVTWHVPYLFRTPPGFNLHVRGPANQPKDGVQALEGIVETDWANASFTVNWQLTRPGLTVRFERDEPLVLIVPQRRGELSRFSPELRALSSAPDVAAAYKAFSDSRQAFLKTQSAGLVRPSEWQKDYFRGRLPGGESSDAHEVRLRVRAFKS